MTLPRFLSLLLGGAFFVLTSCAQQPTRAPTGDENVPPIAVLDEVMQSHVIGQPIPYLVIKPENYPGPLPVVYFLHGRGDDRNMFKRLSGITLYRAHLKSGGRPFALVALTGTLNGHDYYWANESGLNGRPWATMLMEELIPHIEKKHALGDGSDKRAIAGISMGSAGAFQLSMNYPGWFKCVAGHSFVARDPESAVQAFPTTFANLRAYMKVDPIRLLRKHRITGKKPFEKVWVDIGGGDSALFVMRARQAERELKAMGYDKEPGSMIDIARTYPEGGHNDAYWVARMPEYIRWYGQCFE